MSSSQPCAYSKLLLYFHGVQVSFSSILSLTAYIAPLQLCCFLVTDFLWFIQSTLSFKKDPLSSSQIWCFYKTVCVSLDLNVCAHVGFTQRVLCEPTPPLCPLFSQSLLLGLINLD